MVKCVEILLLLLSASILSVSAGVRYYEYGGLSFNEQSFRRRVDAALEKTKQFLRAAKEPVRYLSAGDVPHLYDDKFYLADFIAGSAVQSMLNLFRYFGATNENLTDMIEWAKEGDTISLHFAATQHCAFDHWEVQRTESPTQSVVTEVDGKIERSTSRKSVTSVNISHWKMTLQYELTLIGRVDGRKVVLAVSDDNRHDMLLTASDTPPSPSVFTTDPIDIDLSWLLSNVQLITSVNGSVEELATFAIDRTAPTTRTPRRNKEVDEAIDFFVRLYTWGQCVRNFFTGHVFAHIASADEAKIAEVLSTENIFIPVLPVFREGVSECVASKGNSSCLLTPREVVFGLFLEEENRTVRAKMQRLQTLFAGMKGQASFEEGRLVMLVVHSQLIAEYLTVGIEYIEALLSRQLSAAVGKELTSQDLGKYMDYHNAMMLAPEYAPKPFSYAVRRSADSSPEGQIFIEFDMQAADSQNPNEQVKTIVRKLDDQLMEFSLNAATKVVFGGDRYLHALLRHSFSGYLSPGYSITANARQFSSFILILGRLTSATAIEPTHAIIVKDKDFLRIVLHMETIPSAKEFQDATQSLSSEQQDFARAFRSMQLSSTLFALCTIQIKPQLEKVLNLVPDSLTKEIKLTQELMELFIEYQIPTDLLAFSWDSNHSTPSERIESVANSVKTMKEIIKLSKEEAVSESEFVQDFQEPRRRRSQVHFAHASAAMDNGGVESAMGTAYLSSSAPSAAHTETNLRGGGVEISAGMGTAPGEKQSFVKNSFEPTTPEVGIHPSSLSSALDLTSIPVILDANFDKYCNGSVLRSAILNPGFPWKRTRQKTLLSNPQESILQSEESMKEKMKAFELLDALTKSGGLTIDHASLHVIIAAEHAFDKSLINTLIQDNINPISKLEVSALATAATVQGLPILNLLREDQRLRVGSAYPQLIMMNREESNQASSIKIDISD